MSPQAPMGEEKGLDIEVEQTGPRERGWPVLGSQRGLDANASGEWFHPGLAYFEDFDCSL